MLQYHWCNNLCERAVMALVPSVNVRVVTALQPLLPTRIRAAHGFKSGEAVPVPAHHLNVPSSFFLFCRSLRLLCLYPLLTLRSCRIILLASDRTLPELETTAQCPHAQFESFDHWEHGYELDSSNFRILLTYKQERKGTPPKS
jgi:hypothetical protein